MEELRVGAKYSQFAVGADLLAAHAEEDGMLTLCLAMNHITEKEMSELQTGSKVQIGLYDSMCGVIMLLVKFGGMNWMDCFLLPSDRDNSICRLGNAILLHVFDSSNGELILNRMMGATQDFASIVREHGKAQPQISQYNARLQMNRLMARPTSYYVHRMNASCIITDGIALSDAYSEANSYAAKLPVDLRPHYVYVADGGHCINVVLTCMLEEAEAHGSYEDYLVPLPVKYVIEVGWKETHNGYLVCDAKYDAHLGALIPDGYDEF